MRAILFAIALLFAQLSQANELTGRVTGVVDGDTLDVFVECVKMEFRIRLAGIDAPETGQAFGKVSMKSLSDIAFGKAATVEWHKRDKYGRLVGKVLVGGLDTNLEQVKLGLAWHFKEYEGEQSPEDRDTYAKAEMAAKEGKAGLWRDPEPIPPRTWRHMTREERDAVRAGE